MRSLRRAHRMSHRVFGIRRSLMRRAFPTFALALIGVVFLALDGGVIGEVADPGPWITVAPYDVG